MLEIRKAVARVRKKNIQAEVKKRKIRINCQQKRCFILANLEVIYSEIGGGGSLKRGLTAPTSNPPAAKVASQGDAHVRTDTQIKFLYYPLVRLSTLKFSVGSSFFFLQVSNFENATNFFLIIIRFVFIQQSRARFVFDMLFSTKDSKLQFGITI